MASTFKKGDRIYISWWDCNQNRTFNKSTGLEYNRENLKRAKIIANKIQAKLDQTKETIKDLGIPKVTLTTAFERFLSLNVGKHPTTIYEYKALFERLSQKFPPTSACTIINKSSAEEWLISVKSLKYSRNTKAGICKMFKKFLSFLMEYNYIPPFKLNKDVITRPEVKEILIFDDEDASKLFAGLRDKNSNFQTMFYLLYFTGLRPSDIYLIEAKHINFREATMKYYSPKTDEYYEVALHEELLPILKHRAIEIPEGKLLDYESINNIGKAVRRYLKQQGLHTKGYNLRTFRKNFISVAHSSGIELATVSKLVGHKNINTTARYYNKFNIAKQGSELKKIKLQKILPKTEVVTEVETVKK